MARRGGGSSGGGARPEMGGGGGARDQPGYTNDNVDIQIHREHHSTGILDGTDEAYSSGKPSSDTYPSSGRPSQGPPRSITPTLAWMRRLEESYTTSPAVAHAGLWADVSEGRGADRRGPPVSDREREKGVAARGPTGQWHGEKEGRRRHVAAEPTAPIYPRVDRTATGTSRPGRAGAARDSGDHGAGGAALTRRRRACGSGARRRPKEERKGKRREGMPHRGWPARRKAMADGDGKPREDGVG
uniref:Uncharacterized protein n=1 Tax=Oryza sativa subsp. japonica TaxID=39947 RepID=Q69K14_ORYSJ|nr:hypothetical protein [Oryza sativa Japonica Group]